MVTTAKGVPGCPMCRRRDWRLTQEDGFFYATCICGFGYDLRFGPDLFILAGGDGR